MASRKLEAMGVLDELLDTGITSVATAQAVESQLFGRCALNKLGKIMKILVELE